MYKIKAIDAGSVGDLLRRSFSGIQLQVDKSLNAVAVTATSLEHQRIADALAQIDVVPGAAGTPAGVSAQFGTTTELVTLKSAVPGATAGGIDATASFQQALQVIAPDVHVVQLPTPGTIALIGPAASVRLAKDYIEKVDVVAPLVVLDTEILEMDESVAKNLGVQLGTAVLSTTYSEIAPQPDANGLIPRIGRLQALGRTPISFTAQVNLLLQQGKGRVLADPRITTLSGRTASIRAGDTISILTTTAGNVGTIATTQIQSFQTGVTLDITPLVDAEGGVTVALHPVVNSLIGAPNGVPEISTRDTQTTVHLLDNETLVIGGLIQEDSTRTTTKLPILGDAPLIGRLFRNDQVNSSRNELIIVVTPHLVKPGMHTLPGPAIHDIPQPAPLPTLPPNTHLPPPGGQLTSAGSPMAAATPAVPTPTSLPSAGAAAPKASAAPLPFPTAFAQTNVFTFGTAPSSNYAKNTDPVQIFYASLSPTVLANGTSVRISVITTTNASGVKLQIGSQSIGLSQIGPGQWQATFPFPAPSSATTLSLPLIATRGDGAAATITIPVNVTP